jgi:hypothetical protein
MRSGRRGSVVAMGLVALFLVSLLPLFPASADDGFTAYDAQRSTPLGQATTLTIGSWPDGANERVKISVPDGESLKSVGIGLESNVLPMSLGMSLNGAGDFAGNAVYDGMDVNSSSLQILPQGGNYDFESGTLAPPEWTLSGVSNWAIRADSRLGGAQLAKAGTITHNQESAMTLDVSQLPAASGTFRYSVSSEGSFDYLIFCIDNTGCSRFSGYSQRWSGTVNNGQHSFTIPANAQTLTWKYTKDGSVSSGSDTAWVDEIIITPTTGSGNGEGNWTSEIFGPSMLGRGEGIMHGFLHMDAFVYPGSVFEWQILDAQTGTVVPGFERITGTQVDLGMIDAETHPLLRLKVHMKEAQGGGTSEIRSISHNGIIMKSFDSDPTSEGWQIQAGNWANGAITSSGTVLSNTYHVRSGFSSMVLNNSQSGAGVLEYSLDAGESWAPVGAQGRISLNQPAFMVQFRMQSLGGTYTWNSFEVELVRTSVPDGLRMDVGLDGTPEWSLDRNGYGLLGLQNRLVNDEQWSTTSIEPAVSARMEVALPVRGVDAFSFAVASPTAEIANPFMAMAVNGQDILSRTLPNIKDLSVLTLSDAEMTSLNDALAQASNTIGQEALPMATVEIRIGSSLSTSDLLFGGVFAPYAADINLTLSATSPLVMGLNHELSKTIPISGQRTVSLPVRMDGTGSVLLSVNDLMSQSSVEPLTIEVLNVSDTLVPGNDWVDTKATFDFLPLGVEDAMTHAVQSAWEVELQLIGQSQQSRIRCPVSSLPITPISITSCTATGTALLWFDEGQSGSISATASGSYLEFQHHFKFPDGWDDEPSMVLSVHLISSTGPMLPVTTMFGLGNDQGVENDIEVQSWSVISSDDIRSSPDYPYLRSGELVNIEVVLGFENTVEGTPRSGQALIRFLVDGNEYATTSIFQNGVALFPFNVPTGRPSIDLGVEVVPLRGQDVVNAPSMSHTFLFDNVAPTLIDKNVERFDSRDISPRIPLSFTIADRPHLPSHALINTWRSWHDDANSNGVFDAGEHVQHQLTFPSNMTNLMGEYTHDVDTSMASQGDFFLGWLEVADSAGHLMEGSGLISEPMFHVQLNSNGAPSLGASSLGWPNNEVEPWFHPHELNQIHVPVWEQNGIFDLQELHLELASNTVNPSMIVWNQTTNSCTSMEPYVEVESCSLQASEEGDLFSRNGVFVLNFSIDWGYDPDTSLTRVPRITLIDQSGQSNRFTLEPLAWRFSGELELNSASLRLNVGNDDPRALGYWVQPRTTFDIEGDLVWFRTGDQPTQDFDVELTLGENEAQFDAVNGTFSGSMMAPLKDGTYGLFADLVDAPNGAVYRGDGAAFIWFIVDNEAPSVAAVDRPAANNILDEESWSDLQFELRLDENARIDESSLALHWSLNEAGLGLNSYVYDNGSVPLEVLGERLNGDSIPVRCVLDVDSLMLPVFRTKAVELRIWVTGMDEAGMEVDSIFNDIDAPLRVWTLEQRVPSYEIAPLELKPSSDLHQGDLVEVATMIQNNGLADGEANVVLELVESTGARTRLDARIVNIQSGETVVYQFMWKPSRDGSQWLEMSIINGPNVQSPTVLVDQPRSDGVLGTISSVNPALLGVVVLLTVGLVALLVFGLRREPVAPSLPSPRQPNPKAVAVLPAEENGPYGQPSRAPSPGENPYQ